MWKNGLTKIIPSVASMLFARASKDGAEATEETAC